MNRKIEFISYTGKWPNLCRGILTLKVDGEEVTFKNCLESGGNCGFMDNYRNSFINEGAWSVSLPEDYKDIQREVEELVNSNVQWGCCGGCL